MKKRTFSLLLCLVLCLSLMPTVAFAAADTSWYNTSDTEFTLVDADDLYGFASLVNGGTTFEGKTVKLGENIDLGGGQWTPIGGVTSYPSITFYGTFDGQDKTISNFTVNETGEYAAAGLFGSSMGTIKNVIIDNATISSTHYAGGIAAYSSSFGSTIMNCTVRNSTIISEPEMIGGSYDNGDKVGGIMGYNGEGGIISGCLVENVALKAYRDVGGIVGCSNPVTNITGNTVRDITVYVDQETGNYGSKTPNYAAIVGRNDSGAAVPASNIIDGNNTLAGPGDPIPGAFAVAQIGTAYYKTLGEAVAAAADGDEVIVLKAGTYKLPNLPENISIKGSVDGVVIDALGSGNIASVPSGASFENLTFNFGGSAYHGFQHAGDITMKDCTLNGLFFSYGNMSFDGCTFNAPGTAASGVSSADYSMWAYGQDLTFTDCTFNCAGKCINVYCENNTSAYNITASGCTFNSSVSNKAAFNVKETSGANVLHYNVAVTNCTANENFPKANADTAAKTDTLIVFDPLVQVDDRIAEGTDNGGEIQISLNGSEVYRTPKKDSAAWIGFTGYDSLQDAVDAAEDGDEIEVVADNQSAVVNRELTFVLSGNGAGTAQIEAGAGFEKTTGADGSIVIKALPSYTVSFNMNGHGTQVASQTIRKGSMAAKPADPAEEGWTFEGWYSDAACSTEFDFTAAINADVTVYAKWTENTTPPVPTHTVTFNMNGHGTQVADQTVNEGGKATKPADPTASGWTFGGWYADATFSTRFDFNTAIMADTTIYAKWTENTTPPAPTYTIIVGANSEWTKGSNTGLLITSDAPFAKFDSVQIDGSPIAAANYTAAEGSTKITLLPSYLETLSIGSHSIVIVSKDGKASTRFAVKPAAVPPVPPVPPTGDNSNMFLWLAFLLVSGGALAGTGVCGRKRKRAE